MPTRQELYERIAASSKPEVILEEMVRLGFWPQGVPPLEEVKAEDQRRLELQAELHKLTSQAGRLKDLEKAKRELRQRRLKESRERQKATKLRVLRSRQDNAEAWRARKAREVLYLGAGASAGLNQVETNEEKLRALGLPVVKDAAELALAMGATVAELRFLAYAREVSTVTHYHRFQIPKKSGGLRTISAPMPRLKRAQRWIYENVLAPVPTHPAAHGFLPGRSIVSNAGPHVGADVVVNVDLEGFFPSVNWRRAKGAFRWLGYGEQVATVLALICSEADTKAVELDGTTYHVATGPRRLPQGAPTSPALTNLICKGLDARLAGMAKTSGFVYTRYADDLTFSGSGPAKDEVGQLLRRVRYVVKDEGLKVHPDKVRVCRSGRRQDVTGLVVNEKVGVPRETLRRFRALLFQVEKDGPAGKRWGDSTNVLSAIEGFANFVAMVDPQRGEELRKRSRALALRHRS